MSDGNSHTSHDGGMPNQVSMEICFTEAGQMNSKSGTINYFNTWIEVIETMIHFFQQLKNKGNNHGKLFVQILSVFPSVSGYHVFANLFHADVTVPLQACKINPQFNKLLGEGVSLYSTSPLNGISFTGHFWLNVLVQYTAGLPNPRSAKSSWVPHEVIWKWVHVMFHWLALDH